MNTIADLENHKSLIQGLERIVSGQIYLVCIDVALWYPVHVAKTLHAHLCLLLIISRNLSGIHVTLEKLHAVVFRASLLFNLRKDIQRLLTVDRLTQAKNSLSYDLSSN